MASRAETDARLDVAPAEQGGGGGRRSVVPQISVVLCTYNRAERVGAAVRAILDQHGADLELIVVDDGSTDDTPAALAAIDDDRLAVVRRANGGLSAARNSGLAAATAPWVVFIDDDDTAMPGWLAAFVAQGADDTVGIACCGAQFVDADGTELFTRPPTRLGPPFDDLVASTLAGSFAVRTELARRAGGYLDGLGTRHQTELFIRLLALAEPAGLRVSYVPDLLIHIEARLATNRPGVNPRRLYDGTRWIMARHPRSFAGQPQLVGLFEGVVGTNAARLGDWRAARRRLRRAVRATPRSREAWGRLALASVPPLADRVWNRHGDWATHDPTEVGVLRQVAPRVAAGEPALDEPAPADPTPDEPAPADPTDPAGAPPARRELFLAWRYEENPPLPPAGNGVAAPGRTVVGETTAVRSDPVRRLAERLARRRGWGPVVEVSADGEVHDDAPDGRHGSSPSGDRPRLVLCHDALHRVDDPVALLHRLTSASGGGPVMLSTPDRAASDPGRPLGPPSDPRHRREWTIDQLELLLLSCALDVERTWRVAAWAPASWAQRLSARAPRLPIPGVTRDMLVVLAADRRVTTS